ncbi:MAG: hypothetical protein K2H64_08340 [Desulfovibrio sp.]|nr:hypothetical protein [Desulfovibrio sp.]
MEHNPNSSMIYTYTRKQAIKDGVLVDITGIAKDFGFIIPVAITADLLVRYVRPTAELEEVDQSMEGRLAIVLTVLYFTAKNGKNTSNVTFKIDFLMEPEKLKTVEIIGDIGLRSLSLPRRQSIYTLP